MPFSRKIWVDGPGGGTPITAAELNRLEQGVKDTETEVEAAEARASGTYRPIPTTSIDLCAPPYNLDPGEDVTAALQAAIDIIAATGKSGEVVFSKAGTYLLNGAPQTGTALGHAYNGQVLFPAVAWDGLPNLPIRIRGLLPASSGAPSTGQASGVILQSNAAGAYMFDMVPFSTKWDGAWTGIMPFFEDIILRGPAGGTAGGVNALCALRARFDRVTVDTVTNPGAQPTGTLTGIVGPRGWSNGDVTFRDVSIRGLHTAIRLTEHGVYDNLEIIGCENAFEVGEHSHTVYFQYVDVEQCKSVFKVPNINGISCQIQGHVDLEAAGVASGDWNAPVYLTSPGSSSAITGTLSLNLLGDPAGSLALGGSAFNLDLSLLYATKGDRGGIAGWRCKHPADDFSRMAGLDLPSTSLNPGLCWPSLHPWRNWAGFFTVSNKQLRSANPTGAAQAGVPAMRGGFSRRVSMTVTLAASAYNTSVYASRVRGGANIGKSIEWRAASGNLVLVVNGTTRATVAGAVAGSGTYTLSVEVIYGTNDLPQSVRAYKNGTLATTYILTAAEVAALAPDMADASYPYVEDGVGFWQDVTSYITNFAVRDLPPQTPAVPEVYIGATQLALAVGSPNIASLSSFWSGWLLDPAGTEGVSAKVKVPEGWLTYDILVRGANHSTGAGDVVLRTLYGTRQDGDNVGTTGGVVGPGNVTTTAGAQNIQQTIVLAAGVTADATKDTVIRVERMGADDADTLANDYAIGAIVLRRAT